MNIHFFNDTKRMVHIHPETAKQGIEGEWDPIPSLTIREFRLPAGEVPRLTLWDQGDEQGLLLLMAPSRDGGDLVLANETAREIGIHPAMTEYGVDCDTSRIRHGETRTFGLPHGAVPLFKMWDHGKERGMQVLIIPHNDRFR